MNSKPCFRLIFLFALLNLLNCNGYSQAGLAIAANELPSRSEDFPTVNRVETPPLLKSIRRLMEAMSYIGSPLPDSAVTPLEQISLTDDAQTVTMKVQALLDPLCIAGVSVTENGAPLVARGEADALLMEQGRRTFLVKVVNQPGRTQRLVIDSPNAQPLPQASAADKHADAREAYDHARAVYRKLIRQTETRSKP